MGKFRTTKPGSQVFRPKPPVSTKIISPRLVTIKQPANITPIRGASINRVIAREIKRDALRQGAPQQTTPPGYSMRPITPPLKVMPKTAVPVQLVKIPSPVRPPSPPAGAIKTAKKPAVRPAQIRPSAVKIAPKPIFAQPTTRQPQSAFNIRPAGAAASAAAIAAFMVNVASADPQISAEVNSLNSSLDDLKTRSSLKQILEEVNRVDTDLIHAINLVESARQEGYVYQKDIDEIAYQAMDQWQAIKGQLQASIPQQAAALQNRMLPLGSQLDRLNSVLGDPSSAAPFLSSTSSQVNSLLSDLYQVESSLENNYEEINRQVSEILARLNLIHWSLDQLSQAKFRLDNKEKLVIAVQARWDQEGDNDPEGILYLTNERLIFERKEKVATKKILFITTAQELIQEVLVDQKKELIVDEKAVHKGLFKNQDFLELKFSDAKLGDIPFHLNGQDCGQWIIWVRKVKSGEIEKEHTTGSGISFTDFTGPLTTADILAIQNEVNSLQDVVMFKAIREELGKIENDMRSLERVLSNLRARGYAVEKSLESDIAILAVQWDRIKSNAESALANETKLLAEQMIPIKSNMSLLAGKSGNLNDARPLYMQIKSAIASTEAQADAADDAIIASYDEYAEEVDAMSAHLEWVGWMLDALSGASFQLLATESGIAATEATWDRPGFEPENGILFLTDQRLLWEDRVETFELKVEQSFNQIKSIHKDTDEASGKESLIFELEKPDPYPTLRFPLNLPVANAWIKIFGRARSGEYIKDRAVEIDQAELERIRKAPNQCSNCGAGLTDPILRGQTEITCEYCGQVTRI
jgi:uncharacterized protein (DUF3084 family)